MYRQCCIQALGGAILGAAIWMFSERISDTANLNTSPFLRLLLPALAATYLATWVSSPFIEFTAGSGAWWVELAGVLLYVAAVRCRLAVGWPSWLEWTRCWRRGAAAQMSPPLYV